MSEAAPEIAPTSAELLATGRRHLAVKDYSASVETLGKACEVLAQEHGDTGDQCAEAYLWYGKALLGLSREESGVLGDGMPGAGNTEEDENSNPEADQEEDGEAENGEEVENGKTEEQNGKENQMEEPAEKATESSETAAGSSVAPGPSNGETNDESVVDLEEDDVDNLQLAWEMLDLSRSILQRRDGVAAGAGTSAGAGTGTGAAGAGTGAGAAEARALLAEVYLTLGEVALESETYDKAVADMQSCLELQKELYGSDDRRIAETHYKIGLANSLASSFDDAITHFKNAANILESRIKTLEGPEPKHSAAEPSAEVKELREVLPEIHEKIQDMMEYKAETIRRVRESIFPSNGGGASNGAGGSGGLGGAGGPGGLGGSGDAGDRPASNISHLIKRKRKSTDQEDAGSAAKRPSH